MILFASISILISRTHVFLIIAVRNYFVKSQDEKIPITHQVLLWFSGLRGAVAFALGVTFLEHPVFDTDVKGVIFGTTVMVVVLTVIILGGLTPYMLVWLGIVKKDQNNDKHDLNTGGNLEVGQSIQDVSKEGYKQVAAEGEGDDEAVPEREEKKSFFYWIYDLDNKYLFLTIDT